MKYEAEEREWNVSLIFMDGSTVTDGQIERVVP